jgi:ATP-dependent DNA helicase RecG
MIEKLLAEHEGKTIEFKETARSLSGIMKTVVAFANTAGGTIVIGVKDKTKE